MSLLVRLSSYCVRRGLYATVPWGMDPASMKREEMLADRPKIEQADAARLMAHRCISGYVRMPRTSLPGSAPVGWPSRQVTRPATTVQR